MIKLVAILFTFSLAYSGQAPAQQWDVTNINTPPGPAAEIAQNSPFIYPPTMHNQLAPSAASQDYNQRRNQSSFGGPVVVLPMPPIGNSPGYNNMHGFQYPGSYMPRDTPLHKFNGYVTCDPPNLTEKVAGESATDATARRLVKITSTRSLAAPDHQQPCPVYTINGEIPKQKDYTTTTKPLGPNAPRTIR